MSASAEEIVDCIFEGWETGASLEAIIERLVALGVDQASAVEAIELACTGYSRAAMLANGMQSNQFSSDYENDPIFAAALEKACRQLRSQPPRKRKTLADLDRQLGSRDLEVRRTAVYELGQSIDAGAIPRLFTALNDPDLYVRIYAIQALSELRAKVAVARLCEILASDRDATILSNVIRALVTIGDQSAVESLIQATTNSNAFVRHDSAWALGELNDPRAISALESLLEDQTQPVVRDECGITTLSSIYRVCDQAEKSLRKLRQQEGKWWKFW